MAVISVEQTNVSVRQNATVEQLTAFAREIWTSINGVNLHENILPTRARAHLVLEKGPDHAVRRVRLRAR